MNSKHSITIALCFVILCTFNQCKSPEVSTASKKSQSIYKILKIINFSERTFDKMLTNAKRDQGHFKLKKFDKDLTVSEQNSDGFKAITISTQTPTNTHVIFLHGGAYIQEATKAHRLFIEDICFQSNCKVSYIDYPLAPENNALTTHKIINQLYQILLKEYPKDKFILMGDSAGGGLALSFLQTLVTNKNPRIPQKTILLSPWLDVEMNNPEIKEFITKDVILNNERLIECGKVYADKLPTYSPLVSPINGTLDNLGSIKIFVSTHELFYPDCTKIHEDISKSTGSHSEITIVAGMVHDWILFPIEESEECTKEIIDFINK